MIFRKIFISLFIALFIPVVLSPVAGAGQGGDSDLAVAQDRTRSVEDRSRAVMALGRSGDPNASGPLLQILKNPAEQRKVRAGAVMALARIGEPRAEILSAYETTYKSPKSGQNLRYTTLLAFGTMKAVESLPLLTEALSGGDDRIRFKAAQALGMIGDDDAVNLLLSRLEAEGDRMVRAEIVRALAQNESASVEGALVRVLRSDTDPLVRYNAALCLAKFTSISPEGREALRAAGGDSSPMVRKAAGGAGR
ncbi:MAG TPA: HEAT repeat domain-containing protein [Syntrophales bacterium]|nr:HEAT repeat domain-containing protein [Syntrophales bacterium]HOX94611.1 HEAT repeat domain-containing protein [Syntrophales bacterium]HPI58024.1 HEAT repeat domain-containing protein [Syntrophales bacterium]HPN25240.1 HEAT repeat domain-containing protein [Syntrophales bacterium]HQM29341.1 HEAT repeat domain-containing protein [Syntrophales bacterium]